MLTLLENMTTTLAAANGQLQTIERVLIQGDLSGLSERDRLNYYRTVCDSLGLNYLTSPFAYIKLQGKLTLYAKREATEQLRKLHSVSVQIVSREMVEDIYVVTSRATLPDGRCDESIGAVYLGQSQGEARANQIMKAETKAKRRVTLSLCGLALLDETEVETIPGSEVYPSLLSPTQSSEIWRTWKSPADAVLWAGEQLPRMSLDQLQAEFDALPASNGKKAPAWIKRIQELLGVCHDV